MRKRFISVLSAVLLFSSGLYVGAQDGSMIPTFEPGQILTAAELNALGDAIRESSASELQNDSLAEGHLTIFDANGAKIGESIGLGPRGNPLISMSIEGQVVVLGVREDGFFNLGSTTYFDDPDCAGTPLITRREMENRLLPIVKVFFPGQTLYIEDRNAVDELEVQSLLFQDFADPRKFICFPESGFAGVPIVPAVDLDTLFTPPFTVVRKEG